MLNVFLWLALVLNQNKIQVAKVLSQYDWEGWFQLNLLSARQPNICVSFESTKHYKRILCKRGDKQKIWVFSS